MEYKTTVRPFEDDQPPIPPVKIIMRAGVMLNEPEILEVPCHDLGDVWDGRRRPQYRTKKGRRV